MKYPKIKTLFKRDPETNYKTLIEGKFSRPEFEYLQHCAWRMTEKVPGQSIRVMWDGIEVAFGGRGSKSDKLYKPLLERLEEMFPIEELIKVLGDLGETWTLFGEGYGAKIQKGGENYIPDGVNFILFDINVGDWWLKDDDVCSIAEDLHIEAVPVIEVGPLSRMIELVKGGLKSHWGDFEAEGIVARPIHELKNREGKRIITKLKCKDF